MKVSQMGKAASAPVRPSSPPSSIPTQTTVSSVGVNPANQASLRPSVVPVLPAASGTNPDRRTVDAVPLSSELRRIDVTKKALSADAIRFGEFISGVIVLVPATILLIV